MENIMNRVNDKNDVEVQEIAILIVSHSNISVTTSLDDAYACLGDQLKIPDNPTIIMTGEKECLLKYAHKIKCMDELNAMENYEFHYPEPLPQANITLSRSIVEDSRALPRIFHRL